MAHKKHPSIQDMMDNPAPAVQPTNIVDTGYAERDTARADLRATRAHLSRCVEALRAVGCQRKQGKFTCLQVAARSKHPEHFGQPCDVCAALAAVEGAK